MMRSGPELPGLMRVVTLQNHVSFLIYLSIDEEGQKERADIDTEVNLRAGDYVREASQVDRMSPAGWNRATS
jgi:hypothetical protein